MKKNVLLVFLCLLGVSGCNATYLEELRRPDQVVEVDGYKLYVAVNKVEQEAYVSYAPIITIGPDYNALRKASVKAAELVSQCESTEVYRPEERRLIWIVSLVCN